ncbi:acyl-CoA dehydrogenase family protein [Streptosporangium sp. NBC_01755]|nr:acyl-CoA dehydrogenase family protein [Streptosporangium sp. NBC_01755]
MSGGLPVNGLELRELRDLARAFCGKELVPNQERWASQRCVDARLWRAAGDTGLLCIGIPGRYGGGGGTFEHEMVLIEEQAMAGDTSWGVSAHGVVAHYVLAYGTEEQKRSWLPRMASGELVGAIAITEPAAGSDIQAVTTRAEPDGDGYRVNGSKTFVTNGTQAGLILVMAQTTGLSLLAVETAGVTGLRRGKALEKIGRHGQDTCELFFDDMPIPADAVLGGKPGLGLRQLIPFMSMERLHIAVAAVASMAASVDAAIQYAKQRKAFGRKLIRMQNTQFKLAECATEVAVARAFVAECVREQAAGELTMAKAAMAKLWATERLSTVVDDCLQVFGGYGYMSEYPVARAWTDARVARIFGGTSEIMKGIIAASL